MFGAMAKLYSLPSDQRQKYGSLEQNFVVFDLPEADWLTDCLTGWPKIFKARSESKVPSNCGPIHHPDILQTYEP